MRTSALLRAIPATLLLASVSVASAVQVTFRVNMSVQVQLGHLPPGTPVQVAGSFNGWDPGAGALTQSVGDPNIYEGTFEVTSDIDYKFVRGSNGWEVDGLGPNGAQNRQLPLPATDTVLPVVFFDNQETVPGTRFVTFQVDMSVQIALGRFDPMFDIVQVAGPFTEWGDNPVALYQSQTDTNIWINEFVLVSGDAGGVVEYKYISAGQWEDNGLGPNGEQNRRFILEEGDQVLPAVFFNDLDAIPPTIPVTFQVNMATQMAYGNFAEGVNEVWVAGSFNNWSTTAFQLTNSPATPTLYTGTTNIVVAPGSTVDYKFVIDSTQWEEGIANRTFVLADSEQVLDVAFWNSIDNLGRLSTTRADDQIEASWPPGPLVRLQVASGLGPSTSWTDVPNSQGQSNATVTVTTDETYLRLVGP